MPFSLGKELNTMKRIVLAFLILISSVSFAFADTIFLRDGRQIRGTLLGFINGRFVVRVESQTSSTAGSNVDRNRRDNDLQYFRPEEVDRMVGRCAKR